MVKIGRFTIDAAPVETHNLDSELTPHPIEEGADVSDHVRVLPDRVVIEGLVSNAPVGEVAVTRENETPVAGHFLPADDALAYLRQVRDDREPIMVETQIEVYESMVLTNLSVPRDTRTGDALRFRATFQQALIVRTERTSVPVAVPRAQKKSQRGGKQSPSLADSKALEKQKQITNKLRKGWGLTHNPDLGTDLL